ncbi:MAG: TetR/AcrR family transcriptional regulator [Hyphomonas sp.]
MSAAKARQTRTRRPKQSRAQSTVSAILEGAAQVLAERGWAGFNTNAVAERAGVSIGSLYEYFTNKQAIADAIVSEHLAKGEALLSAAANNASGKSSLESLVASVVDGFVNLHKDDPRLHRVLSSEVPLSSEARIRVGVLKQRVIALVATALDGYSNNPKLTAQLLVETADTLTHRWFAEDNGNLISPEIMTFELRCMLSAYLVATAGGHVQPRCP